jgi:hypothetical protein
MSLTEIPQHVRTLIEEETKATFYDALEQTSPQKRCLHWAIAAEEVIFNQGLRACINAGTANWKANDRPAPYPTHVGHFWQGLGQQTICDLFLKRGILPEMHCWIAFPDEQVIFDPTTAWLKDLAEEQGIPWTEPDPPESLWCDVDSLPDGWMYVANRSATMLAYQLLSGARAAHGGLSKPRSIAVMQ